MRDTAAPQGTDLFVMSAVCSYAAGKDASAVDLADLFCQQARARIAKQFRDIRVNPDKAASAIAKKILGGEYEWIENEIIKQ